MRKLLLFCFISIYLLHYIEALEYALINCSWPCPDPKQVCVVTTTTAFCGSRDSDIWMINEPEKSPFYTGAYVSITHQPCQKVPIPLLPVASQNTSVKEGETIIQWPISSARRPQDEYLGNCGHGLYCASTGQDKLNPVCRHRLDLSSACNSSNQCLSRFCLDGVCQSINNSTKNEDQLKPHHNYSHPTHNSTGHILAGVFGSFGAVVVALVGFLVYRHRKHKREAIAKEEQKEIKEGTIQPQENTQSRNSAIYNNTGSRPNSSFLSIADRELVQKQFASDFQQEHITTPAMQQRHLQQTLRNQSSCSNINIADDDPTYLKPPPSYKP